MVDYVALALDGIIRKTCKDLHIEIIDMAVNVCDGYWYGSPTQTPDFDGDGTSDLLITTGIYGDYDRIPTKVCAVKGACGTPLWCKNAPTIPGDLDYDYELTPADAAIALEIAVSD